VVLIFKTDAYDALYDSNPQNNWAVAQVVFNLSPPPDLVPIEIDAPPVVTVLRTL